MIFNVISILFILNNIQQFSSFSFPKSIRKVSDLSMKTDFTNHPSDIVNSFKGQIIGREWSYTEFMNNLEKNKVDKRFNKLIYKKGFLLRNFEINILKSKFIDNKIVINTSVNVFTMFCIMYSIYFRKDLNISIIYIFMIRTYLNKIKSVISNYFMKKVN